MGHAIEFDEASIYEALERSPFAWREAAPDYRDQDRDLRAIDMTD
jgi:hypothetical protein